MTKSPLHESRNAESLRGKLKRLLDQFKLTFDFQGNIEDLKIDESAIEFLLDLLSEYDVDGCKKKPRKFEDSDQDDFEMGGAGGSSSTGATVA